MPEKSSNVYRNIAVVEDFVSRLDVLPYDDKAAWHYGSIRAVLEKLGQPIGLNDLHIVAHARSKGLSLVSNNLRDFERVPGLLQENWIKDAERAKLYQGQLRLTNRSCWTPEDNTVLDKLLKVRS